MRLAPRRGQTGAPETDTAQTTLLPSLQDPVPELPEPLYAQDGTVFLQELPSALLSPLRAVQAPLQDWLEANPDADAHAQLLELYFAVQDILRSSERYDSHFVTQLTARGSELELQLLCLDPAPFVEASLAAGRCAALFSATLTPPSYYRGVLGCADARAVALPSPFPAENLGLYCMANISTRYRDRGTSVQAVSDALARLTSGKTGNYLAFFQATPISGRYMKILQRATRTSARLCRRAAQTMLPGQNFLHNLCRSQKKLCWVLGCWAVFLARVWILQATGSSGVRSWGSVCRR